MATSEVNNITIHRSWCRCSFLVLIGPLKNESCNSDIDNWNCKCRVFGKDTVKLIYLGNSVHWHSQEPHNQLKNNRIRSTLMKVIRTIKLFIKMDLWVNGLQFHGGYFQDKQHSNFLTYWILSLYKW